MRSIYNVEYCRPRQSVYHWETAVEADNREAAKAYVRNLHGNVVIGQVRFVGMVGVNRSRPELVREAQSGFFEA